LKACQRCDTARCCVVFDPELTGADLVRLARGLGVTPLSFCRLAPVRADEAGPDGIRLGGIETWELRLRRTAAGEEDPFPGGARRCLFLMHLAPGTERCGVHPLRPMLCRTFPAARSLGQLHVGTAPAVCPEAAWEGLPPPEPALLGALEVTFDAADLERGRWRRFLSRWNAPSLQARLAALPTGLASERLIATIAAFESPGADEAAAFERAVALAFTA
jgi:Fe-S-cluster containining protein